MEYVLQTYQLSKRYNDRYAVRDLDLKVKAGEIYGFLGQNGAGKTTTLRMIMGLIQPTSGEVELFGERLSQRRQKLFDRVGSIIEFPGFYTNLTAAENLEIHRRLMGMGNSTAVDEVLELVGLTEAKYRRFSTFSLGMKQRLGVARSLLHHPELLILDEPTNGLDPAGIKEVRQLILDLSQKRKITVLISSHILSEVQQLASKIGIIHQGRLLEEVDYKILEQKNRHYIELKVGDDKTAAYMLEQTLNIKDFLVIEKGVLRVYEQLDGAAKMNRVLVQAGIDVHEVAMQRDSLEDYFLKLTGGVTK